jgi:hypothetical protein
MSAFLVDRAHIAALIETGRQGPKGAGQGWNVHGLRWWWGNPTQTGQLDHLTEDAVGQMLWEENRQSLAYRYPTYLPYRQPLEYGTHTGGRRLTCVETLKAISCLEYQSCEHPGWEASEAHAFCEAFRHAVISRLPGYDGADGWSIEPEEGGQHDAR